MKINESRLKALRPRTVTIEPNNLSEGFRKCFDGEGSITVKNLSYDELQKLTDEVSMAERLKNQKLDELKAIDNKSALASLIISIFDVFKDTYDKLSSETIRRIGILKYGVTDPEISHTEAVLIAKNFSVDFKIITDQVLMASQMGSIPLGESEESTKEAKDG